MRGHAKQTTKVSTVHIARAYGSRRLVSDDYGYPACRGERNAADKFFADKNEPVITLPSGQGLVIRT
jgi:hypothetical protein